MEEHVISPIDRLMILAIAVLSWTGRRDGRAPGLPTAIVLVVAVQATPSPR